MDEQRMQAYMELIEQLLGCPQGEEDALLQAKAELMDAGLLEMMEQVATHLKSQGEGGGEWLQELAIQLRQALEIATPTNTRDAMQFLWEALQLLAETQGNPQQVYTVWAKQQEQLNGELLAVMPIVIAQLFAGDPEQSIFIAAVLNTFGNLINQFPFGMRWLNLELGIAAYELALQVRTRNAFPEQWATTQNNLATAYLYRVQGDRAENLEHAITAYELALQVRTRDSFPEDWAMTQNNLANAYVEKNRGGRAENLERAIAAYELALQVRTRDSFPEDWAMTQNNLANACCERIRGDRAENIEQAIAAYELALQVLTYNAFPEQWAATQNNLASAYCERIRGDRAENIEQAIAAYELALQVRTRDAFPEQWAVTQNNLATAYFDRIRGDRAENIEQAVVAYELALQVRTRDAFPEQWATTQNNLATAYLYRVQGDRAENLERAIAAYELALQVRTRDAFPEPWAGTQNNLAAAYSERIEGDRVDNLEHAIAAYELALQVRTREAFPEQWAGTQNNLATAYFDRIQNNRAENLEKGFVQISLEKAIVAYELALQVRAYNTFPNKCRQTARNLGTLHFEQQRWEAATTAYTTALAATETLYQSCILLDGKAAELQETVDLPRRFAYALARIGNLIKAVETLEQGRARGLSESLDRDRTNLDNLKEQNETLYTQYKDITQRLRNLEAHQRDRMVSADRHSITPETLRNTATSLHQQFTTTIDQIRQQPNYETFLTLPTFEDVRQAATPECPLIYLLTTPAGSLALIVSQNEYSIWLDNLTEEKLLEILNIWLTKYRENNQKQLVWAEVRKNHPAWKASQENDSQENNRTWLEIQKNHPVFQDAQKSEHAWYDEIDTATRQLWDALMGSLVQQIKELGFDRITFIPTGYLSLFPLHAAWTEDESKPTGRRYVLDDLHITYAPNAQSLTAARAISDRVQADSILAIDNPSQDLDNSEREIQAAIASFLPQATILRHHHATTTAVKTSLPQAAIAHFSCHGTANLTEPLNSGLLMSDGLLTLKDIFALNLADTGGLRLAILSACETGMIGIENADETISLPTGLLQAGVAAIIASLWSVSDLSTMLLLTRFYHLWCQDRLEPAVALRSAQQWVRNTTNGEKVAYFKDFLPEASETKMPGSSADYLYKQLILSHPDARDFAHPFHWAAFSYTGV